MKSEGVLIILILMIFSVNVHSQGQEIYLNQSELPAEWSIVEVVQYPDDMSSRYGEKFGVEVKRYDRYILRIREDILQISILECSTELEAEEVYKNLLEREENEELNYQTQGNKIIMYSSAKDRIIEQTREINLISDELITFSKEHDGEIDYLSQNHAAIDLKEENSFKLLDEDIKDKQIFLTGENHGVSINDKLRFEFLKYFQEKAGVKYHLIESSHATAELLNRYLETEKEEILKRILSNLKGTYASTKERYEYWQEVYQFNQSLPEDEQIKVVGIDNVGPYSNSIWYLHSLLPDKDPPNNIARTIQMLEMVYEDELYNDFRMVKNFITMLNEDIEEHYAEYKSYLGEEVFDFKLESKNLLTDINARKGNTQKFHNIREMRMYENFKNIYSQLPEGKVYGHMGATHILQQTTNQYKYLFGELLNNEDSSVKEEVLSIHFFYQDSEQMNPGSNGSWQLTTYNSSINLEDLTETDLTLFKLTGESSPFAEEVYWVNNPSGGVTTDYYQYMFLINKSKAATPFE